MSFCCTIYVYTMHIVLSFFTVFQGFGDSAQGFTNFIIYCIFTDTVRRRMVAVCLRDRGRVSPEPSTRRTRGRLPDHYASYVSNINFIHLS